MPLPQCNKPVVYLLGAGFSCEAEMPLQGQLLPDIVQELESVSGSIPESTSLTMRFLNNLPGQPSQASLEDVFTIIDEGIASDGHCLGCQTRNLRQISEFITLKIVEKLWKPIESIPDNIRELYASFTDGLVNEVINAEKSNVPSVTIVSLNWDTLIEDFLLKSASKAKLEDRTELDFACDTLPLSKGSASNGVLSISRHLNRIPVLKLHGSIKWLLCPACKRMFSNLGEDREALEDYSLPPDCPKCSMRVGVNYAEAPELQTYLVTPTFLKKFDSVHIKQVWQRAFEALSDAGGLFIIGYSMPEADYHLRSMLARSLKENTQITAVLSDDERGQQAAERYKHFFSDARIDIHMSGALAFFKNQSLGNDID